MSFQLSSQPKSIPVVFPTKINCLPDQSDHSNDNFIVVAAAAASAAVNDLGVVVLAERKDYHFYVVIVVVIQVRISLIV